MRFFSSLFGNRKKENDPLKGMSATDRSIVERMIEEQKRIQDAETAIEKEETTYENGITETERLVTEALAQYKMGYDGDEVYHPLYKAWKSYLNRPEQLFKIKDCGSYGQGLFFFLSYGTISDCDERLGLINRSYYFYSKQIKQEPNNLSLYQNRALLVHHFHVDFNETISSAVGGGGVFDDLFMGVMTTPLIDEAHKMIYSDLSVSIKFMQIEELSKIKTSIERNIISGKYGNNTTAESFIKEGIVIHENVFDYIERVVLGT